MNTIIKIVIHFPELWNKIVAAEKFLKDNGVKFYKFKTRYTAEYIKNLVEKYKDYHDKTLFD